MLFRSDEADADAALQDFLSLPAPPIGQGRALDTPRGLVEVSKVTAAAPGAASPAGQVGSLGLGLRGLSFSPGAAWGERRNSSAGSEYRTDAVRMLERCGSHSRSASAGTVGERRFG